uniref:CSON008574 protein n=1 Tax=Culicoides sonorensis TaxID=179676 RepID=A0A336MX15_CULSO
MLLFTFIIFICLKCVKAHATYFNGNLSFCENEVYHFRNRQFRGFEFNEANSGRQPRLFSVSTEDKDVNVRMEFAVPFVTIPTKRTIDGLQSAAYSIIEGKIPKPEFNLRAMTLIGLLTLTFSTLGTAIKMVNQKLYEAGKAPNFFRSDLSENTQSNNGQEYFNIPNLFEMFDKTLAKYNIDSVSCIQRTICVRIKESRTRIMKNRILASKLDTIIEGVSRTEWILNFIAETAIADAVKVAQRNENCDLAFPTCSVNLKFFYGGIQKMVNKFIS